MGWLDDFAGGALAIGTGGLSEIPSVVSGNGPQLSLSGQVKGVTDLTGGLFPKVQDPTKGFQYANPNAFQDPNAQNIYNTLQQGFNRTTQGAPLASLTALGAAPQYGGATVNTASDAAYQQAQNQYINQLNTMAQGGGPNLAALQAQQQAQQNIQNQMAVLGSARGASNPALAQRGATDYASAAQQQNVQVSAMARLQQQLAAQQMLGGAISGARGQTQDVNQLQAQLAQQAGLSNLGVLSQYGQQQGQMNQGTTLANQQAILQQNQLNNQFYNQLTGGLMNQNQADIANQMGYQQLFGQQQLGAMGIQAGVNQANAANTYGLESAGLSALGAGAGMAAHSDQNVKTKIKSGNRDLQAFLQALNNRN